MAFTYQDMGHAFHEYITVFSVMTGWITEILFKLFFVYIAV